MKQPFKSGQVICAAVAIFATVAWIPSISFAQPAGPVLTLPAPANPTTPNLALTTGDLLTPTPVGPGYPVFDAAVANNTDIAATSLSTILQPPPAPNTVSIASLDQALFAGVNSQNDTTLMPVTEGLPCDSYTPMTTQIAPALMQTFTAAISTTQQLMTELQTENSDALAASVQAPAQLAATQAVGQGQLAIIQELRLIRAQLATLTMVVATDALHQLDANVRSQMPRQGAGC
jgi:hypothetical protein